MLNPRSRVSTVTSKVTYVGAPTAPETDVNYTFWLRRHFHSRARITALQKLHKAYGVTGVVRLDATAKISATIVNDIYRDVQPDDPPAVGIGHPNRHTAGGN